MIIDISVAFIAAAFVILAIFLIAGIVKSHKTLDEGVKLIKNLNETTVDVKKKLHALDFLFNPLTEGKGKKSRRVDLPMDIVECLSAGVTLYNKIKGGIGAYVKGR